MEYQSISVFTPENLLREARRQKSIHEGSVPKVCILDPDGDIVQNLFEAGLAQLNPYWACYHTRMYNFTYEGIEFGIVGKAVGASFAVLVAEEMFACGCELLISMTSAGQIITKGRPPYFVLIEKALRDEGTSYHYLPPSAFSTINAKLMECLTSAFEKSQYPVKDIAKAKTLFRELLGKEPYADDSYYVGFKVGNQDIGLGPNGHKEGMTAYYHVDDIKKSLRLLLDAGAKQVQEIKDVGGGRLIASVKDADGNIIGLIQDS